jgi:hypothetical protein
VPDRLAGFFIALMLFYRRCRYGYPFRRITLSQGKYAIVDPEDFERLNKHKWYAHKIGNTFYAVRTAGPRRNRRNIWMHREIIRITEDALYIDGFLLGSKCVPFSWIKTIKILKPTTWNGKFRIVGTGDFQTWFSSDGSRPSRDVIFVVLMHGKWIRYGFTVEDSEKREFIPLVP